jgi:hypothetical protein
VEPSAVAARRTRASLALAVGGALFLMTGVALTVTGAALKLEHQVRLVPLVVLGLVAAVLGLALGASAMVAAVLDQPTEMLSAPARGSWAAAPPRAPLAAAGPPDPGETAPGEALSSFVLPGQPPAAPVPPPEVVPGSPLRPPGRHRAGPVPHAREPMASELLPTELLASEVLAGYSDTGWSIEADDWARPPTEPPQEARHPVRR